MFQSAIIKLTLWYMATIIGLCFLFSLMLYHVSSNEISAGLNNQVKKFEIDFSGTFTRHHLSYVQISPKYEINERSHHLIVDLLYFNLIIDVIAGFGSYALAKRTLMPLEEAHEQQARFTSDVSHELRTPLSAIRTESEVSLIDPTLSNEDLKNQIKSNLDEVSKMEKLINNLLRISKLENQDLQKSFVKVNLEQVISNAKSTNMKNIKQKNIDLKVSTVVASTLGNEDNLSQAVSIILDNAIKYSKENSNIDLTLKRRKSTAQIVVKDYGIGIATKDMPYIFDRFYRAEQSRSRDQEDSGYGLGLPLAKFLVELHNGTIHVASIVDKGTTVTISLPLIK
jgi:two-component system, OmpR family, sensor histidine kinase CiaH